uniref:Candidate secreted effector n=1 Tax=Meloidogyne incognita TaxID=6306 RepID=A0A914LJV6_MELIC
MTTKSTIFLIFAICFLVNYFMVETKTLTECCKGCTSKKNSKNCNFGTACQCVANNFDPEYDQQCNKKEKMKDYVFKHCKHA